MASLTPGVLSKLLENSGNSVTREHRKALLQVTEIVPRLSEDTWQPHKGYFLKLSDSLHSAYVSVSDSDAELIRSDNVRLGQFIYVTRLESEKGSPVPLVRGLNPLPKRRPCVGNPVDLVSSEALNVVVPSARMVKKKKKDEVVVEMRRLSVDSSRRVWDHSNVEKTKTKTKTSSPCSSSRFSLKSSSTTSPNVVDKKVSLKTDSPLKSPISSVGVSPLKNKNENWCAKTIGAATARPSTPRKSATTKCSPCAGNGVIPSQLVKVPLNFKTWYHDKSESWECLPSPLCNLGQQVATHRNVAFLAAVRSLEEAYAADTVVQCMRLFDELCRQTLSAGLLVKQFLELHLSLQRVTVVFDSLLATSTPPETKPSSHTTLQCLVEDACKVPTHKNAISWVQAAIGTNLSRFNLFRTQEQNEVLNGEMFSCVVIENSREEMNTKELPARSKQSHVTQTNLLQNSTGKRFSSSKWNRLVVKNKDTEKRDLSKESELKVAASLAEKLLLASREWFLKYLEESLENEFGLKNEGSSEIACLFGQLKKVNDWLDNFVGEDKVDHRVENLRKSLYRFLLEHVKFAVASS